MHAQFCVTYCWWQCCFFQKAIRSVILHVIKFIVWPEKHLPWMITSLNGCQECSSSLLAWSIETRYLFCKSYLRTKTFYACCLSTYYVNFTGNFVSSLSYLLHIIYFVVASYTYRITDMVNSPAGHVMRPSVGSPQATLKLTSIQSY